MTDSGPAARRARFARNVDRLRRSAGLSKSDLAARAELEAGYLEAILRGEVEARVDVIYLLAGALGVYPGSLFEGVTWTPGENGPGEYQVDG